MKILGIGSALVDSLAFVSEDFIAKIKGNKGGMELVTPIEKAEIKQLLPESPMQVTGGSAANTIVGLAQLGIATGMLCKVGKDDAGTFYRKSMKSLSIDTSSFKYSSEQPTGECLSLITPDSQRTMRTDLGAAATLTPQEICNQDFANYTHVHLEGYLLFNRELMLHILKTAKQANCQISLDLAAPEVVAASMDILPQILTDYIHTVFANEDEAHLFAACNDDSSALTKLSKYCQIAVVKLGKNGSMLKSNGQYVRISAPKVTAIDTTGAGDLWAAGFLYGQLKNQNIQTSANIASAIAAEVVQQVGASIPNLIWKKLKESL